MTPARLEKAGRPLIASVAVADTRRERMRGLLGRPGLPVGHALYLAPCRAIHTIGMRFPLDLIFVDRSFRVVRIVRDVAPCRLAASARAYGVFELQAGWLGAAAVDAGDALTLSPGGA